MEAGNAVQRLESPQELVHYPCSPSRVLRVGGREDAALPGLLCQTGLLVHSLTQLFLLPERRPGKHTLQLVTLFSGWTQHRPFPAHITVHVGVQGGHRAPCSLSEPGSQVGHCGSNR